MIKALKIILAVLMFFITLGLVSSIITFLFWYDGVDILSRGGAQAFMAYLCVCIGIPLSAGSFYVTLGFTGVIK